MSTAGETAHCHGTGAVAGTVGPPGGPLLAGLLPATVRAAEAFGDPDGTVLFPEEEDVIAGAAEKRRREFTTVRHCARQALAALDRFAQPVVPGECGAPCWPAGIVGSMTHCRGYRVARSTDLAALGIDAEPHAPLPPGVLGAVVRPEEREHLDDLARCRPEVRWGRLLFSAKERAFKTWVPLTRAWLSSEEVSVRIEPVAGTFRTRLVPCRRDPAGRPPRTFHGRWVADGGLAVTAVSLPPRQPDGRG